MQKLKRQMETKKMAGICAGLGDYFKTDPVFFRIGFIVMSFVSGVGLVAYVVMWLMVPVDDETIKVSNGRTLMLDLKNKKLGGVSSGLGAYFDVDPVFFRVAFCVTALVFGFGLVAYLILWLIMPRQNEGMTTSHIIKVQRPSAGDEGDISGVDPNTNSDASSDSPESDNKKSDAS